jgi:hypothetical protein
MKALMLTLTVVLAGAACTSSNAPQPAAANPAGTQTSDAATAPASSTAPASAAAADTPAASAVSAAVSPAGASPQTAAPAPAGAPALSAAPPSAAPSAPAAPKFKEVVVPSGTRLTVRLSTALASDTSHVEDAVRGTLARDIRVDDLIALPAGSPIAGNVVSAQESGRVKGKATLSFRFNRLTARDESHDIRTAVIAREAEGSGKDDLKKGGIGAGAGAIIGGVLGGGKGAAIGAGVGGTGAVLGTKGKEVEIAAGETVTTTLQSPLTVLVPTP